MRVLILLAVLFPTLACADTLLDLDRTPESARLREVYLDCLLAAVERYEPVEPSAATIALAAQSACSDRWAALLDYYIAGGVAPARVEQTFQPVQEDIANRVIQLVLDVRAGRP